MEDLEPIGFFSLGHLKVLIGNSIYSVELNKDIGTHMQTDTLCREVLPEKLPQLYTTHNIETNAKVHSPSTPEATRTISPRTQ